MSRTRIKICGITRVEDALCAIAAGADALGFVFVPTSPRYISPLAANAIILQLPPLVTVVGLFMDNSGEDLVSALSQVRLDLLQFHGDEAADFCAAWDHRYIKSIPMGDSTREKEPQDVGDGRVDPLSYAARYVSSAGFLLDSNALGESGGSGKIFDWKRVPQQLNKPIIVAGGLNPHNVKQAVIALKPYGVDVSSGVESAKGIKDQHKMIAFINAVNEGNQVNASNS